MLGEQREAARRRLPHHQQLDDRGVDRAAPGNREAGGRELPDLLVGEAVVGRRALVVLHEQAGGHGRRHRFGERLQARLCVVDPELDLAQVLQAEVSSQHGRLGEGRLRIVGEVRRPPRDQRSDGRRHQPFGVAGQRPDAVDLLDHPPVAVRVRHLLDDERDALRLRVHRRGARGVHGTAEDLLQERLGLRLAEPAEPEPPD